MNTKHLTFLNLAWKAGVGLIGLTALAIGLIVTVEWYRERYGRSPWLDKTLSKDVVVEAYNNNCVRVRNKLTGQYTTPKVKWVSGTPERDSLSHPPRRTRGCAGTAWPWLPFCFPALSVKEKLYPKGKA